MLQFIGLLTYIGIVEVPWINLYWNMGSLYRGLLPPRIMSRSRFTSLLGLFHVSDPDDGSVVLEDKFRKISWLLQQTNQTSAGYFQPHRDLSVDKRTVKLKARSGIRQYIREKMSRWGYKFWVLAGSKTGYTVQFCVCTIIRERPGRYGLDFDISALCMEYLDQCYKVFMDNFYTSSHLFVPLLDGKTLTCGTMRKDRRGFPTELKGTKREREAQRGDIPRLWDQNILYLLWNDRRW